MRISPFGAAMTISNVASISIMGLSRARRHRDFLFEADRMTGKISAGGDRLRVPRAREIPSTPAFVVAGSPGPYTLRSEILLLWGQRGKCFRRPRVPGTVSIRSHYGPNSDTGLCEVKARGEFSVFPTPCYSAPLGPRLAGLFREMRLHSLIRGAGIQAGWFGRVKPRSMMRIMARPDWISNRARAR